MLKIKELLKSLIETQKQINESLKGLKEDLKPKYEGLTATTCRIDTLENCLETNVYTKDETVKAINKEIDYKNRLEKMEKECPELLQLIEIISTHYANMDKYNILATAETFSSAYEVKRREN